MPERRPRPDTDEQVLIAYWMKSHHDPNVRALRKELPSLIERWQQSDWPWLREYIQHVATPPAGGVQTYAKRLGREPYPGTFRDDSSPVLSDPAPTEAQRFRNAAAARALKERYRRGVRDRQNTDAPPPPSPPTEVDPQGELF